MCDGMSEYRIADVYVHGQKNTAVVLYPCKFTESRIKTEMDLTCQQKFKRKVYTRLINTIYYITTRIFQGR